MTEPCLRCGAEMEWRHGTWQCPRCRLKLGCCEGEPQSARAPRGGGGSVRRHGRVPGRP
ncbi:MAG TPA: hypothetical protein VFB42_03330 [Gaiellaceae bacterium]|nr:hypothetical protein [Gaiellaceae bacterium]